MRSEFRHDAGDAGRVGDRPSVHSSVSRGGPVGTREARSSRIALAPPIAYAFLSFASTRRATFGELRRVELHGIDALRSQLPTRRLLFHVGHCVGGVLAELRSMSDV